MRRQGKPSLHRSHLLSAQKIRIGGAGLANDMICSINHEMPRASMPVVVAREIENPCPLNIQSHIEIIRGLIKKMAGVRALVAAAPVVGAAHVSPRPNPL